MMYFTSNQIRFGPMQLKIRIGRQYTVEIIRERKKIRKAVRLYTEKHGYSEGYDV